MENTSEIKRMKEKTGLSSLLVPYLKVKEGKTLHYKGVRFVNAKDIDIIGTDDSFKNETILKPYMDIVLVLNSIANSKITVDIDYSSIEMLNTTDEESLKESPKCNIIIRDEGEIIHTSDKVSLQNTYIDIATTFKTILKRYMEPIDHTVKEFRFLCSNCGCLDNSLLVARKLDKDSSYPNLSMLEMEGRVPCHKDVYIEDDLVKEKGSTYTLMLCTECNSGEWHERFDKTHVTGDILEVAMLSSNNSIDIDSNNKLPVTMSKLDNGGKTFKFDRVKGIRKFKNNKTYVVGKHDITKEILDDSTNIYFRTPSPDEVKTYTETDALKIRKAAYKRFRMVKRKKNE